MMTRFKDSNCSRQLLAMFAVSLLVLASTQAFSQETKEDKPAVVIGDWSVKCHDTKKQKCIMSQRAIDKKSKAPLFRFSVRKIVINKKARIITDVQVPLGAFIPKGVLLTIDTQHESGSKQFKLNYTRCTRQGCIAALGLSPSLNNYLRNGSKATLSYTAKDGKQVNHRLSLAGSAKAIDMVATNTSPKAINTDQKP